MRAKSSANILVFQRGVEITLNTQPSGAGEAVALFKRRAAIMRVFRNVESKYIM